MRRRFVSFDGTESCEADSVEPDRYRSLHATLDAAAVSVRGAGLSYCLASAAEDSTVVSTAAFDRIIALTPDADCDTAELTVESGARLGPLMQFLTDRGYDFPVLPGHPDITVGGCIGCNVHGKTQHDVGHFSDHVRWLTLFHPDHGLLRVSPTENRELFELTLGGFGLTGYIEQIGLQVMPLAAKQISRRAHPAKNLIDAVEVMERLAPDGARLYSWNDMQRRGTNFGAGLVFEDRPAIGSSASEAAHTEAVPHVFGSASPDSRRSPISPYNKLTWAIVNRALRVVEGRHRTLPVLEAAFPISGREVYFALHGKNGFREYQMVIPRAAFADAGQRLQQLIASTGACVTLGSLKLFSGSTPLLWFRGDGVCLTVDGSANAATAALFAGLDDLAISLGAPVNIAKDSRLSGATVRALYPHTDDFADRLRSFDPAKRFTSELRRRIDV